MRLLFVSNIKKWDDLNLPNHKSFYAKKIKKILGEKQFKAVYVPAVTNPILTLYFNIKVLFIVLLYRPHVIYCPINVYLIAIVVYLKAFLGLNVKILRWKYTSCKKSTNILKNRLLVKYYTAFDKVYFLTKSHRNDSIALGILSEKQAEFIRYGVDLEWFERYTNRNKHYDNFLVVSTGVENRDFPTLCEAVLNTDIKLHIITKKNYLNVDASKVLNNYLHEPNITIDYSEDLLKRGVDVLDYIEKVVSLANCIAVCAKPVNYGVGYTQVVESLPFGVPILQTYNVYNPINMESENIGYNLAPYDIENWKKIFLKLKKNKEEQKEKGSNALKLAKNLYNSEIVAMQIFNNL